MKLVQIRWIDSAAPDDYWHDKHASIDPVEVMSVGYIIARDEHHVSIIQSVTPHCHGGLFAIPAKCILSIRKVK